MASYHSFELGYLSAVYTNLLVTKEPMDLFFKPQPGALPDTAAGRARTCCRRAVKINQVWVNGHDLRRLRRRGADRAPAATSTSG